MQRDLDFLIVGAQKSATTTLFRLLQEHPAIFMPKQKELPYFVSNRRFQGSYREFMAAYFGNACEGQKLGKASPQYMADPASPALLRTHVPNVKLIAILRDPIERAKSQYKMEFRRGAETRSFSDAIRSQLVSDAVQEARTLPDSPDTASDCYIAWSEYGRIVGGFLDYFPRQQLLVVFTDDLSAKPVSVLRQVYAFLNVDADFVPANVREWYHRGGVSYRYPVLQRLISAPWVRALGSHLPPKLRGHTVRLEIWNAQGRDAGITLDPEVKKAAIQHFQQDLRVLRGKCAVRSPWDSRFGM
jgi:hypothetical protein